MVPCTVGPIDARAQPLAVRSDGRARRYACCEAFDWSGVTDLSVTLAISIASTPRSMATGRSVRLLRRSERLNPFLHSVGVLILPHACVNVTHETILLLTQAHTTAHAHLFCASLSLARSAPAARLTSTRARQLARHHHCTSRAIIFSHPPALTTVLRVPDARRLARGLLLRLDLLTLGARRGRVGEIS